LQVLWEAGAHFRFRLLAQVNVALSRVLVSIQGSWLGLAVPALLPCAKGVAQSR
jgi:hypothetical protein